MFLITLDICPTAAIVRTCWFTFIMLTSRLALGDERAGSLELKRKARTRWKLGKVG